MKYNRFMKVCTSLKDAVNFSNTMLNDEEAYLDVMTNAELLEVCLSLTTCGCMAQDTYETEYGDIVKWASANVLEDCFRSCLGLCSTVERAGRPYSNRS